jgi:hypothetical protein
MHYINIIFILLILVSCKKEEPPVTVTPETFKNGYLVLNEGLFQQNNSTLSWIDLSDNSITENIFSSINNRPLGDTGNDLKRYGGKVYIVLNGSSTVEVLNAQTLKSIQQINLVYNQQPQQPRSIAFSGGKAYISSYDGYINVLDTVSLTITNRIAVGNNPEGVVAFGDYLYVANSGGLNFPNVDSTVFKINLNTLAIEQSFHVGANPRQLECDDQGNVYVVKQGNYGTDPAELIFINTSTNAVTNLGIPATTLFKYDQMLYLSYYDFNAQFSSVKIYDLSTQALVNNSLIPAGSVQTLYGVHAFDNGDVVCFDAQGFTNSGYLKKFDVNGSLLNTFSVALNPNKLIYYE